MPLAWEVKDVKKAAGKRRLKAHYFGRKERALYFRDERRFGYWILRKDPDIQRMLYREGENVKAALRRQIPYGDGKEQGYLRDTLFVRPWNPGGVKRDRATVIVASTDHTGLYYGNIKSSKSKNGRWIEKALREAKG